MAPRLDTEARMTIQHLTQRGVSRAQIARTLGVTEGSVRYHLQRQQQGAIDGRKKQVSSAAPWHEAILTWLEIRDGGPLNLTELHRWLVEEHGYPCSRRSIQRYYAAHFPQPKLRARRRVETPPGAQAQVDWAEFRGLRIGDEVLDLYALHMQLSWSRYGAVIWSQRKNQLAWQHAHNEALRRLEGVAATMRVDNEKTAVSRGAGAWGEINPDYRRYAEAVRFHVDACPPRSPEYKGKVERRIRDHRLQADPRSRAWSSLEELQTWTDERMLVSARRRICPATGTSVLEAFQQEKRALAALPILPEPFDLVATRTVGRDGLVAFESRQYSVPFRFLLRSVEVRGCAGKVQILADGGVVASWPRHSAERLLVDPIHYEGPATERVLPPPPLGRMGKKLQEIAALQPQRRPIDLYAALAEAAR